MELAPKAQVLEGRGIWGHFQIQSLGNAISRSFQEVFSTVDAMLFRQNIRKTWNNTVGMSQAFHDIARFERFKYAFNVIQNWETDALQILFHGAYFLLAVMVEGRMRVDG